MTLLGLRRGMSASQLDAPGNAHLQQLELLVLAQYLAYFHGSQNVLSIHFLRSAVAVCLQWSHLASTCQKVRTCSLALMAPTVSTGPQGP
jgi:hypothetical protein